jgi:hypothetical protein
MSKNDDNIPPESLTLRLKKAETAVEVAPASLKSIRTLVERQRGDVANQAQQSLSDYLLKDLKKLNKQQAGVSSIVGALWIRTDWGGASGSSITTHYGADY